MLHLGPVRVHPLTGMPFVPIGMRKNGTPIWPILGGSEDPPAGDPPASDPPAQDPPASPEAGSWDGKVESLPEPVQKMIRDLRKEAGDNRVGKTQAEQAAEAKQQEMVRALAKAAGIQLPGDDKPDAEKLTQELTAAQQAQRQAAIELAVYRTAAKHSGDPDSLLDSRAFLTAVGKLNPTADTFAADIDKAIKTAVDTNPKLKAGRVPGASGADHTGGSGEQRARNPLSLDDAVSGHYGTA